MELNVQVISNNLANMTHHRLQAPARRIPGPAVRSRQPDRHADLRAGQYPAGRHRSRLRRQDRRHAAPDDARHACRRTGGTLDVAIRGDGFFKIQLPDGTYAYTRDGSFQMDATGRIVTAQGNVVMPAITIPQNSTGLTINAQGQVSVIAAGHHDADRYWDSSR